MTSPRAPATERRARPLGRPEDQDQDPLVRPEEGQEIRMFATSAINLATGLMLVPTAKARPTRGRGPLAQRLKIVVVLVVPVINATRRVTTAQTVRPLEVLEQKRSRDRDRDRL